MNVTLYKCCQWGLTGAAIFILNSGCDKFMDHPFGGKNPKGFKDYSQVNLVGNNNEYSPAHIDAHLLNAWGIAFSSTGIAWVSSQEGHVSAVYDRDGNMIPARPEVAIPSPAGATGGNPTGQVVNMDTSTANFKLSNNATARFFFVGVDGVVSGWNGAAGNSALVIQKTAGSVYTGVTMAQNNAKAWHLYAANFATGKIDVWDKNFASVNLPFNDPDLPAGYAPFNIQNVGGKLFVLYAKVGSDGEEETGPGKGFVDIYNADGMLEKRFASREQLNAPWGVAQSPETFFSDENGQEQSAILIGNFGDGRINAYSLKGKFLGQLRAHGQPIEIEGLWAIMFPPATSTIDPNRLYFAAGPDDEKEGLFGYIIK